MTGGVILIWCLAVIRLGNRRSAVAKMSRGMILRSKGERNWRTSSRTDGYVKFSGTVQAFQTRTKGKCRRFLLIAGGLVVRRLACEGVVILLLCLCMRPREQGTRLIDKSNVGRFDCVLSTCMHFPRLSGVWMTRQEGQKGQAQGPAFACLCRM